MGVDCRGVNRVIHFGPSKNVESYVQETGRAGRDGHQSIAYVLYHGAMLNHIDANMKYFVKTKECRRKNILNHFECVSMYPEQRHMCCDNCAAQCNCGMPHPDNFTKYPVATYKDTWSILKERGVSQEQVKVIRESLLKYHKSTVMQLVGSTANGNVKTLTNLKFMLGFSQHQTTQVLDNVHRIFSLADVYKFVEIWDKRHAQKILLILNNAFADVDVECNSEIAVSNDDNFEFDDDLLDEWCEFLQDDELYDMIFDNLSLSQPESSLLEVIQTMMMLFYQRCWQNLVPPEVHHSKTHHCTSLWHP